MIIPGLPPNLVDRMVLWIPNYGKHEPYPYFMKGGPKPIIYLDNTLQENPNGKHGWPATHHFDSSPIEIHEDDCAHIRTGGQHLTFAYWLRNGASSNVGKLPFQMSESPLAVSPWQDWGNWIDNNTLINFRTHTHVLDSVRTDVGDAGRTTFICCVKSPSTKYIYLDGVLDNSTAYTTALNVGTGPFTVGSEAPGTIPLEDANIWNIMVWHRVLGPREIYELYKNPPKPVIGSYPTGLSAVGRPYIGGQITMPEEGWR